MSETPKPDNAEAAAKGPWTCVVCGHEAELDVEGIPVCKDCYALQGSVCNGPLYRAILKKRQTGQTPDRI